MLLLGVAILFAAILIGLSVWANARFRHLDRLPMQWSFSGQVNWSAPRVIALSLTPVLGTGLLAFVVIMGLTVRPRVGQEGMIMPALVSLGATLIVVQLLHFWLVDKTLNRNGK